MIYRDIDKRFHKRERYFRLKQILMPNNISEFTNF